MAHIKCRYFDYRCNDGTYEHSGMLCDYPEYNAGCENFTDHWMEDDMIVIRDICKHAYRSYAEFEGDYKKYEVDDNELHIPRKHIDMGRIVYLEIDERVLIGKAKGVDDDEV